MEIGSSPTPQHWGHSLLLGNVKKKPNSPKFPLQPRIPQAAHINTLSLAQETLHCCGNMSFPFQLNHMLQIPFDDAEDFLDFVWLVAVWPAARCDLQHVIRTILCEKLVIWDLGG